MNRGLKFLSIIYILISLISCNPNNPPVANNSPVFDDIYNITVNSSSIEFTLNSVDYSTSIEKAVYAPGIDDAQSFRVYLFFADFPLVMVLRCKYENGKIGIQGNNGAGYLCFDVRHAFYEKTVYLHQFSSTYDFSGELDESKKLDSLSFNLITAPNIALVDEVTYPEWINKKPVIISMNFDLSFTKVGTIAVNYTTSMTIDEIRQYDTSSIIDNVPGTIDVFNNPEEYFDDLVAYLISSTTDPVLRVKIIHDWIDSNIYYYQDYYQAVLDGTPKPRIHKSPVEILTEQTAECGGHGRLFQTMCRMAGVRIEYVWVYAKSSGFLATGELESHVCNLMRINGDLYFIDVTYDSNNYAISGVYTADHYKTAFSFMTPQWMRYLHLPRNPIYQTWTSANPQQDLKNYNMKWRGVSSITRDFHDQGFSFNSPVPAALSINSNEAVVAINSTAGSPQLYAFSRDDSGASQYYWTLMEKNGLQYNLKIAPQWIGIGNTYIGYYDGSDVWHTVSKLRWQSTVIPDNTFPRYYQRYIESESHLISPYTSNLKRGQTYTFSLDVPLCYGVRLYDFDGTNYTFIANLVNTSGTRWELEHTVNNSNSLSVLIRLESGGMYYASLNYLVSD